jgi:hypothetical protein
MDEVSTPRRRTSSAARKRAGRAQDGGDAADQKALRKPPAGRLNAGGKND